MRPELPSDGPLLQTVHQITSFLSDASALFLHFRGHPSAAEAPCFHTTTHSWPKTPGVGASFYRPVTSIFTWKSHVPKQLRTFYLNYRG